MIVLVSELGDQHHADLHRSPSEDRLWLRCGQTMIHHDLRLSLGSPPYRRPCVHPLASRLPRVCPPRQPHRVEALERRADLPAVDLAVVAGPAHRGLLPAPAAGKQPMALLLSLFSFGDRARSWPPRAPLDFPEPSPYPQPSIAVGCLVWLATTPSAESCYLSALTLLAAFAALPGPPDSAENLTGTRPRSAQPVARSSVDHLSPPGRVGAPLRILAVVNSFNEAARGGAVDRLPRLGRREHDALASMRRPAVGPWITHRLSRQLATARLQ